MAESTSLSLIVHYVQGSARKRLIFPPGVTAGQARDLCMLRFGVWKDIVGRDAPADPDAAGDWGSRGSDSSGPDGSTSDDFKSATSQSTTSTQAADQRRSINRRSTGHASTSTGSAASSAGVSRCQFGLYWPGHGQWLDPQLLLSHYPLASGDRIELQDHGAFIATPVSRGATCVSDADARSISSAGSSVGKAAVDAHGQVYYLQTKGMSTAWKPCWLELHDVALAGYKSARKASKSGLPRTRSPRDAPLVSVDLSNGFKLVDQSGRQIRGSAADRSLSAMAMLGGMPRVAGGQGAPLIIKCNGASSVHVFCTPSMADHEYWKGALSLVQEAFGLDDGAITSTSSSVVLGSGSSGSTSRGSNDSRPGAGAAASSLVHRPPPRERMPLPHALRPRSETYFAGMVRVRLCEQRGAPGSVNAEDTAAQALCVVVSRALFGLASGYAGPMDVASLVAAAAFTVDLTNTRLHILDGTSGTHDADAGSGTGASFVICILRVADGEDPETEVALAFSVDGLARCNQWTEALCAIGGIDSNTVPQQLQAASLDAGPATSEAPAMRRSRSFGSSLSRSDWPMPPATLPTRMPATLSVSPSRSHSRSNLAQPPHDEPPVAGNPSLEAVGLHFDAKGRQQRPEQQQPPQPPPHEQRVSWFRRSVFRSSASTSGPR